jgi:hypothetical protein
MPRSRVITMGSPLPTFPRLLASATTIERFRETDVRYFAARNDLVVNGPSGFNLRFQAPPLTSDPPLFNWISIPRDSNPHHTYHVSNDMLQFDAAGNPRGEQELGTVIQLNPDQQYRCTTVANITPPAIQFGGSGPDQSYPNCTEVSFSTMAGDVARVRGALQNNKQRNEGNVAVAYVTVPGLHCFVAASSRVDSAQPELQQSIGLVGMATGLYGF